MKERFKLGLSALFFMAMIVFVLVFAQSNADQSDETKVYFLNVGQGDAEYIKTKSGQDILIDGGPDSEVLEELGKVMDFGDRRIDLIVLTHPHADHITGLVEVVKRYEIGEVWESGVNHPSDTYDAWKDELELKRISDKYVKAGDSKNFGSENFKVLSPLSSLKNQTIDNVNNASVITQLDNNKISFLFLGDAEKQSQQKILSSLKLTTVLKIGHHGSENGTLEELLKITRPAIAVIEVGAKNTYGHPTASVIALLKSYAVQIYRTDQDGTVEISTDGINYKIN